MDGKQRGGSPRVKQNCRVTQRSTPCPKGWRGPQTLLHARVPSSTVHSPQEGRHVVPTDRRDQDDVGVKRVDHTVLRSLRNQ